MLIPIGRVSPAGACRFAAASPCTRPYIPSTRISHNEASTRVQAIRPSGLPLACGRPDGTGRPWARASGFAPRRPRADDARRDGDRPSSTDLELPLNSHSSISNPIVHSMRATSRRTTRTRSPAAARIRPDPSEPVVAKAIVRSCTSLTRKRSLQSRPVAACSALGGQ